MKEQDVREFVGTAFRCDAIKRIKLKSYSADPSQSYYDVVFDDNSKIEIFETSATWFNTVQGDEDIELYSSLWRTFYFEKMFKRGEVTEGVIKKYINAIEGDISNIIEAEKDDRLSDSFSVEFGPYIEELLFMNKVYFDKLRDKAETEEEFKQINDVIHTTVNAQLTNIKKHLDVYLEEKVPISVNEKGEAVYNFGIDEECVYETLTNAMNDLDETKRYHIYLNDLKEEKLMQESQSGND